MSDISTKLTYLNGTKTKIREGLNSLGADLTTEDTFRSYADAIEGIYEDYPKIIGEGIELSLDNTKQAVMKLDLKGNTSQETTTGSQLVGIVDATSTHNGITATISNGEVTLNGTATATAFIQLMTSNILTWTNGQTYTVAGFNPVANDQVSIRIISTGVNDTVLNTINEINTFTYSTNTSTYTDRLVVRIGNGTTLTNYKFKPMLLTGSTAPTEWEEYSGGNPAPNPNYPQDIHVVSGDNEISITGKNLLEPNQFAQKVIDSPYSSANASTYNSETGELSIKMGDRSVVFDNFKANTQYTIILKYNIATNGSNLECWYTDNSYDNITPTTGSGTFRFVTRAGKSVASIKHSAYDSTMPRTLYLKESGIFEGVKEITDFEPFGKVYPINLGVENLIPNNGTSTTTNGITFTINADGSVKVNGTATATAYLTYPTFSLKAGTYTLGAGIFVNTLTRIQLVEDITSKPLLASTQNASSQTFTITSDKNAFLQFRINSGEVIDTTFYPQLEKGNKANSFSPYGQTPIELCKIGDYQDYIYKENGNWYKYSAIGKVVLDGSNYTIDGWGYNNRGYILISDMKSVSYSNNISFLTHFSFDTTVYSDGQNNVGYCNRNSNQTSGIYIRFGSSSEINTQSKANTWLSNNLPILYYQLATPTTEEITDATLISQLNALQNAMSYEGQTNISQTNNDLPFIISAKALRGE